jgi:hypothetical protein
MAVLGGLSIACSLTGGRMGSAAVVGPEMPFSLTELYRTDLFAYGERTDDGTPWNHPAEASPPYGDNRAYDFEQFDYEAYGCGNSTAAEAYASNFAASSSPADEPFDYDYGYKYGYKNESPYETRSYDEGDGASYSYNASDDAEYAYGGEADEDYGQSDYGRGDYAYDYESEAAAYAEASTYDDASMDESFDYASRMYGEPGEFDIVCQAAVAEESSCDDDYSDYYAHRYPAEEPTAAADATAEYASSEDSPYGYEHSYAYDKYAYWADGGYADEASNEGSYDASAEMSDDASDYGAEMNDAYDSQYDADESDDNAEMYDDGSSEYYSDDSDYDAETGMNAYDDAYDDAYDYGSEPTYDRYDESEAYRDYRYDGRYNSDEDYYGISTQAEDESRYDFVEHAGDADESWYDSLTGQPTDLDVGHWQPRELLSDGDLGILRDLSYMYEESREVRRMVLNDYLETLGWEALRMASRLEEAREIDVLDFSEDLPGLAAFLATYRRTERDELTDDQAVDVLCHHVGSLSETWTDLVGVIAAEGEVETTTVSDESQDLPVGNETTLLDALHGFVEQSWSNADAAFRNIVRHLDDIDLSFVGRALSLEEASVEPAYGDYYEGF